MSTRPTLHFVYNVDATPTALLRDFVHRLIAPESYPCRLCDLTYGRFLKKAAWNRFVASLPVRSRFHLRGGFQRRFPAHVRQPLPAVFVEESPGKLELLISAEDLKALRELEQLERLLAGRLTALIGRAPSRGGAAGR